ncbi:MAG TPA: TIGR03435 family protein [Bryobacteraceae bacterium]|jgi:uncharacterized protein (TIGR03435 family)|nr:TIGR03435 family protein [Bryobacteraceae bacterium]
MAGSRRLVFPACGIAISLCLAAAMFAQQADQKKSSDDAIANSLFNLGMPKTGPAPRPEEPPLVLRHADLQTMVARAYNFDRARVIGDALSDKREHEVFIDPSDGGMAKALEEFRQRLLDYFQIKVTKETRETEALVLKPPVAEAAGLHEHTDKTEGATGSDSSNLQMHNVTLAIFANMLENQTHTVVIDDTGLKGRYDFLFHAPSKPEELPEALERQLGLAAAWEKRLVYLLVVTKR